MLKSKIKLLAEKEIPTSESSFNLEIGSYQVGILSILINFLDLVTKGIFFFFSGWVGGGSVGVVLQN